MMSTVVTTGTISMGLAMRGPVARAASELALCRYISPGVKLCQLTVGTWQVLLPLKPQFPHL